MGKAILSATRSQGNLSAAVISGGVGGARMVRALAGAMDPTRITTIVNVGDDDDVHGVRVCADLDTVLYTLAGVESSAGWGLAGDSSTVMGHLAGLGADTTFHLGDRDLATCLLRTMRLAAGATLSEVTTELAERFGVEVAIRPVTDAPVRTRVQVEDGTWHDFQDYFVLRRHRDEVMAVRFDGADGAAPAPGVVEAVERADVVVIAPSNPVLSVWPVLAVPGVRDAIAAHPRVVAVSPLFSGKALKGPADRVLASLGLPPGNAGVLAAYDGLLSDLVVADEDAADATVLAAGGVAIHATDTRLVPVDRGVRFATWLLDLVTSGGGR